MDISFFVIQVKTKQEVKFLQIAQSTTEALQVRLFWPRRNLRTKKKGVWRDSLVPIFPGYIFLETDSIEPELYWGLKKIPGFYRFLKSNQDIRPVPEEEARILTSLMTFGEIVEKSDVYFDENNRIRIAKGPLKGIEGRIVKVDKRKGRAKVKLDLYDESYLVDFGFQHIERT